jgi:phosphoserine aminotransferase
MTRPYNFCAGPAALPDAVLERAAAEMLDWHGTGMSFMEMSHRSKDVVGRRREQAEATCVACCDISDDFAVLFTQGGATQFAAVPLNLGAAGGLRLRSTRGSGRARP